MKILFLSALCPPFAIGGYEQLCLDVATGLAARGHECHILTSTYGVSEPIAEGNVYRLLIMEADLHGKYSLKYSLRKRHAIHLKNEKVLKDIYNKVMPDVIFVWNMGVMNRSLLILAENLTNHVVYYLSDEWIICKFNKVRKFFLDHRNCFKNLKLKNVICSCEYLRDAINSYGITFENTYVIHNSVNLEPYNQISYDYAANQYQILYASRLVHEKGAHVLLEAFVKIKKLKSQARLTLVGAGDASYIESLKAFCQKHGIQDSVAFTGKVDLKELPLYFESHSVYVFSSVWPEPFSLTLIMALASGIPVISTMTGGSREILLPEENCLSYESTDSSDLSVKLLKMHADQELRERLGQRGRKDSESFALPQYLDKVENVLTKVAAGNVPNSNTTHTKLLYISPNLSASASGGRVLSETNLSILKGISGLDVTAISLGRIKTEYNHIKSTSNMLETGIMNLQFYSGGLSRNALYNIINEVASIAPDIIYIDSSLLGRLALEIKKRFSNIKIITFFHNIEFDFKCKCYSGWRRLLYTPAILSDWMNEKWATEKSDVLVVLNSNDSIRLKILYDRSANFVHPVCLADHYDCGTNDKSDFKDLPDDYLLFVGSSFPPNIEALKFLALKVMPRLNEHLIVVGSHLENYRQAFSAHNIHIIGTVGNLTPFYSKAKCVVSPIFNGAGMKIKIAESLMHGKCVIGSQFSFAGYEKAVDAGACLVAESADEYIDAIRNFVWSPSIEEIAKGVFQETFSFFAGTSRMENIIEATKSLEL